MLMFVQVRELVSQGKDGGQKGDEKKSQGKEPPQIRRGRFEMTKPGKVSRFNTKRAFGSYFAGKRYYCRSILSLFLLKV